MIDVGIIGTGWVSGIHIEALLACEDARVAAVAGRNLARARELAAKASAAKAGASFGEPACAYASYVEMLDAQKLDAVYICLPPHLHGEVELACARRVKAVFVEKPVGRDLQTVLQAKEAFDRAGTIVSVGYHNRYRKAARAARDFYSKPERRPVLVAGSWVGDMPGPAWWRDKSESGGQFVEQCTHVVDLARWIAGDIVEVSAMAATGLAEQAGATVEDAIVVNARFASGAVGTFATGCFVRALCPARLGIGLSVSSPDSLCVFSGWDFDCVLKEGEREELMPPEPDIFALQARAFVQAVRRGDGTPIMSDYADGIESLKVGLAANLSLARGGLPTAI
ncbi:MAG: Gfo/Idh/MocA family oxidoreductase [Spirochaetaceae bacterium]|nr:Gfo/Idh/MocA family oxidoreductase [Spirochaetaceae bacterium]